MKNKYKRRQDGNRLGVDFGGEVTVVRLALTRVSGLAIEYSDASNIKFF